MLTVTVCLSKASAYLTGGDVTIFTLHVLIGFLVKYSMSFSEFFFSIARGLLVLAVDCCIDPKLQSASVFCHVQRQF